MSKGKVLPKSSRIVSAMIGTKGMNESDLARMYEVTPQTINKKMRNGTWRFDQIMDMANRLGVRLVTEGGETSVTEIKPKV